MDSPLDRLSTKRARFGSRKGWHDVLTRLTSRQCQAVVIAIGTLTYYPIVFLDFQLMWDDQWVTMNFYTERGLHIDNLWSIVTEFYHGQYAPLNQLYYSTLYSAFGYNPMAFHMGGLILHLFNALLVFRFVSLLLAIGESNHSSRDRLVAFLSALLFVVHPVLVESVAWIAASKVLIHAAFFLLSLIAYLKYAAGSGRVGSRYIWLSGLFFILSFGGKEQAVVLPVCLLLLDWVCGRNLKSRRVWLEKVPFLLLALLFGYITMLSQADSGGGVLSESEQYPIYQRFVFACYSLTEYITKCLLPIKLSYIYPFPIQIGETLPLRYWIYPIAIIGGVAAFWNYWTNKWVLFSLLFFVVNIAVTLHIIPISRFTITADRYVYISCIGMAFLISHLIVTQFNRLKRLRVIVPIIVTVHFIYLAFYTHFQIAIWKDSYSLKNEIRQIIEGREDYNKLKNGNRQH